MFFVGKEGEDDACGKATKDIASKGASVPWKGKGTGEGKEAEEGGEAESSMCGQATRSAARRIKEELSGRVKEESRRVLW